MLLRSGGVSDQCSSDSFENKARRCAAKIVVFLGYRSYPVEEFLSGNVHSKK